MGKIKNILIDYGYVLKNITGVGYYILKQKQISGHCYHTYLKRTENFLDKSKRILMHVSENELSEIRKQEYYSVCELNQDLSNVVDKTISDSEYLKKKEYYDNLED